MVKRKLVIAGVMAAAILAGVDDAGAQLFGSRTLGGSLSRRARPSATSVGTVSGNERFLRENRRRSDFVGSDSRDQQGFVGSVQADTTGRVSSTVTTRRRSSEGQSSANRPRSAAARKGMYDPRLVVGFRVQDPKNESFSSTLANRLNQAPTIRRLSHVEVSVAGRTATLRGEVASERDRRLTELLISFEPGISEIHNELTVKTPPPPRPMGPTS